MSRRPQDHYSKVSQRSNLEVANSAPYRTSRKTLPWSTSIRSGSISKPRLAGTMRWAARLPGTSSLLAEVCAKSVKSRQWLARNSASLPRVQQPIPVQPRCSAMVRTFGRGAVVVAERYKRVSSPPTPLTFQHSLHQLIEYA